MAEEQDEPNADATPPGSSESFNQFKDRMLTALTGYAANNDGHNTVVVTHSKGIGVMNAWEHAGYPEDGSLHQATYDKKDDIKPGGHEELEIPDHVVEQLSNQSYAMEDPNRKLMGMVGPIRGEGGGGSSVSTKSTYKDYQPPTLAHTFYRPETREELVKLRNSGMTTYDLADHFNTSVPTINTQLNKMDMGTGIQF